MIEAEIAKLTAAIEMLTGTTEALITATMQLRSSLHLVAGDMKEAAVQSDNRGNVINIEDLLVGERAYREDDAYREKLQRERDEARKEEPKPAKTKRTNVVEPAPETSEKIAEPGELNPPDVAAPDAAPEAKPSTSKENLKDMALAISRADSSSKPEIIAILAAHGAKTITALPDNQSVLFDVFVRLNSLSAKIAEQSK
jgi:hypothetical protein